MEIIFNASPDAFSRCDKRLSGRLSLFETQAVSCRTP